MATVVTELGGREVTIRPFKLKTARAALPLLEQWKGNFFDVAQCDALTLFIVTSLRQDNEWITVEFVEANLEVNAVDVLIGKIGEAMGLQKAEEGKAASP
jgi:hypothetical protein